jgi:hypothetical protein
MAMNEALAALVDAIDRRTRGCSGRQFENIVSPAMADAFLSAWRALGRDHETLSPEWHDMAATYADIG